MMRGHIFEKVNQEKDLGIISERELMFMFAICRRLCVCLSSVVSLLSVCNVRAPYSGD